MSKQNKHTAAEQPTELPVLPEAPQASQGEPTAPETLAEPPQAPAAPASEPTFAKGGKQRSNSAYAFSMVDGKLVWDYPGLGRLVFNPDKASATNRARAMVFGFKQRIIDAAALDADATTGKVDPKAKFAEQQRMIEHLESGSEEWSLKPQAGAGTGQVSYVTKALVQIGQFSGASAGLPGKVDVSTAELANAFVKRVAEFPPRGLKGEMGKARSWLEANSKQIREAIAAIRAAEQPAFDADVEIEELAKKPD